MDKTTQPAPIAHILPDLAAKAKEYADEAAAQLARIPAMRKEIEGCGISPSKTQREAIAGMLAAVDGITKLAQARTDYARETTTWTPSPWSDPAVIARMCLQEVNHATAAVYWLVHAANETRRAF